MVSFLQRFIGSGLVGRLGKYKLAIFCGATGDNGKGVALILRPQCTVRLGNRTTFSGITTVRL